MLKIVEVMHMAAVILSVVIVDENVFCANSFIVTIVIVPAVVVVVITLFLRHNPIAFAKVPMIAIIVTNAFLCRNNNQQSKKV